MLASSVNFKIELIPFAFIDRSQARPFNRTDMHERIRLAVITDEEAEAFHRVEEFDRSGSFFASEFTLRRSAAVTITAAASK